MSRHIKTQPPIISDEFYQKCVMHDQWILLKEMMNHRLSTFASNFNVTESFSGELK